MTKIRKIHSTYYDLPHYYNPKEVNKIFTLLNERRSLINKVNGAPLPESIKKAEEELAEYNHQIDLICKVIAPVDGEYSLLKHKVPQSDGTTKHFWVLNFFTYLEHSLLDKE